MASISIEELHTFYSLERNMFSRTVETLKKNLSQALLVFAMWMWLEEIDYPSIFPRMTDISDVLVGSLFDEAVSCLRCLQSPTPLTPATRCSLPLTSSLMNREISLRTIYEHKHGAVNGIKIFLNTVCSRAFTDILQKILGPKSFIGPNVPLKIPGFPHPVFGNIAVSPNSVHIAEFPGGQDGVWKWDVNMNVTEKDRTMFLTFSRGFPVSREEAMELFTGLCGEDGVEGVYMQEGDGSNAQPLFAKMVLDSIATVDRVLCGRRIAKYKINGKHIWARKYELRHQSR